MKTTLISLQCQHIIRAFVPYFPSNVTLTAHGIKCDNRTLQIKQIQQFRDILDLVFLVPAGPLAQDQTQIITIRRDQMQGRGAACLRTAHRLAIHRDNPAINAPAQICRPLSKHRIEQTPH